MKLKGNRKKYCKHCNKHTLQKVSQLKTGTKRGSLKRGSLGRARKRGRGRGFGNLGKYGSKPAVSKFKRTIKGSKKVSLLFTCSVCGKKSVGAIVKRVKRIEIK